MRPLAFCRRLRPSLKTDRTSLGQQFFETAHVDPEVLSLWRRRKDLRSVLGCGVQPVSFGVRAARRNW
jgi:hypothetical protein